MGEVGEAVKSTLLYRTDGAEGEMRVSAYDPGVAAPRPQGARSGHPLPSSKRTFRGWGEALFGRRFVAYSPRFTRSQACRMIRRPSREISSNEAANSSS